MSCWNCRAATFARLLAPMVLIALWAMCMPPARAWGVQGHQVIAAIAWQDLQPAAREEIVRLLALEPGQTLVSVATWADEHRSPATASWHYLNFPRGQCQFDATRDCPDGQCVVGAIERQRSILASKASDDERLRALKYLVHFLADVHQPLHAGYQDDRGGNTVQLRFLMRGSNLHALWDSGLLQQLALTDAALLTAVQAQAQALGAASDRAKLMAAKDMAQESCRIVAQPGFYPQGDPDSAYVARMTPVVLERLGLAGARLAALLNQALP